MARYLHTMYRITDPERIRAFYEALGLEFRRDMDIVRNGEKEATNYFFGVPGQDEELELTLNHDGRTYDLGYHRLELEIYGFNERAMRHAERAGFVREGVKRKAYDRHGEWVDGVLYGLIPDDLADS